MKVKSNFAYLPPGLLSYDFFPIAAWAPLILYLVVLLAARFYITFDNDEIEAVHTAWKMIHEGVIYRDFFQHHHPLLYYLLIPLIKFFGESLTTLYAARILEFSFFLGAGYTTYLLARLLWNDDIALFSVYLLLSTPMFQKILEIRPDGAQTAFSMISLLFLFYFLHEQKTIYLLISGLALAIAFLFLQKAIFLLFFVGCILWYLFLQKQICLNHIALYCTSIALPIAVYLLYSIYTGSLSTYLKFNWLINMLHSGRFLSIHSLPLLFEYSQLLSAGYFIGLLFFLKTQWQKMIGFISLGLLFVAICIVKFSFAQYYAPAIPLMAMIAAASFYELLNGHRTALLVLMACTIVGPLMRIGWATGKHIIKKIPNEQHKKLEFVWETTTPDDHVYDGKTFLNLFRHDTDFFWFESRSNLEKSDLIPLYEHMMHRTYNVYNALEKLKPKLISNYYLDMQHPIIINNYQPTKYDDIWLRKDCEQ